MKQQIENKSNFWLMTKLTGLLLSISMLAMWSCTENKEEATPDVLVSAKFDATPNLENTLQVTFKNNSTASDAYSWDFGDGNSSTETDPIHTYDVAGEYSVKLIATHTASGTIGELTKSITVVEPGSETKIAGNGEKKWKLYRECYGQLIGQTSANKGEYLKLLNDGSRDCLYEQEWIFRINGDVEFRDNGGFWGEYGPFGTNDEEHDNFDKCFIPSAATMKNAAGEDVSAWGSGTHKYTYDEATGQLELTGLGVWMVIPKVVGTIEEEGGMIDSNVPVDRVTPTSCVIEEYEGYDLMRVVFDDGTYNEAVYVSYDDWNDEPALGSAASKEDIPVDGTSECPINNVDPGEKTDEELAEECTSRETGGNDANEGAPVDYENDVVLESFYNTFETETSFADLGYSPSAATITYGEVDPAGGATGVGMYVRGTGDAYSDAKFNTAFDFNLGNFSTVSIEVYVPSSTVFSEGGLTNSIEIFMADGSQDGSFWEHKEAYYSTLEKTDEWVTVTFDLSTCAQTRADFDMVGLVFGGGGHNDDGTYYIRNFEFK